MTILVRSILYNAFLSGICRNQDPIFLIKRVTAIKSFIPQETFSSIKRFHCICFYIFAAVNKRLEDLIENTTMVFMRYGIKSVTMDDIARELKISKKTLYQHVTDKSDLVVKIMEAQCVAEKEVIAKAVPSAENAIDELMIISEMLAKKLQKMNPSIHYDLEKYYPDAWKVFIDHKEGFVLECVKSNLERGVGEGIYRDNLNPEIISNLYIQKIDCIFDPAIFPVGKFTFYQVYLELMRYHILGVANKRGVKYLTEKISKDHLFFNK